MGKKVLSFGNNHHEVNQDKLKGYLTSLKQHRGLPPEVAKLLQQAEECMEERKWGEVQFCLVLIRIYVFNPRDVYLEDIRKISAALEEDE